MAAVLAGLAAAAALVVLVLVLRRQAAGHRAAREWLEHQLQAEVMETDRQWREHHHRLMEGLRRALDELAAVRLPAAIRGEPIPDAAADSVSSQVAESLEGVVQAAVEAAARQRHLAAEDRDALLNAVRGAVVGLSRRGQALALRIQEETQHLAESRHLDPEVLERVMRVDHAAAQAAREMQSLAVLCDEWPGQQWMEPLRLLDVVRAAQGRILAYDRVQVAGDAEVAVVAAAAEPLIHTLAELLANAAQSSPPTTQVIATVRRVHNGAVVEVDDGGVGLGERELERIRPIAAGKRLVALEELGEPPQTGLAVVGRYAHRHGLVVDLSESVYGGLKAVVRVPAELTASSPPAPPADPAADGAGSETAADPVDDTSAPPSSVGGPDPQPEQSEPRQSERNTGGLPQRPRRPGRCAAPPARGQGSSATPPSSTGSSAGPGLVRGVQKQDPLAEGRWYSGYFAAASAGAAEPDGRTAPQSEYSGGDGEPGGQAVWRNTAESTPGPSSAEPTAGPDHTPAASRRDIHGGHDRSDR